MPDHNMPCAKSIRLEAEMESVKERLDDMKGIGENLTRLTTLLEMQQISNEKQNGLIEQQSSQLGKLGNTVEKLNDKIDRTDKKVDDLDKAVKTSKSKDNISWKDIRNKVGWLAVGILGSSMIYGLIKSLSENLPK